MEKKEFDIERARRDTPGCEKVLHFNNAGAALMPQPVLDAVIDYLRMEAEMGAYESADFSQKAIEHIYDSLAALIGSSSKEIAVIENATRAWDMVFYAIPFKPGDRILTCEAEYGSNYIAFLQVAAKTGAKIEVIPSDEHGRVSPDSLRGMIDKNVKLIAITHVPTNGGLVNPAAEIGKVAREADILYLLDACQSVGQMPVNVREIGCDMLSATSRKFLRGPRGVGFLYVKSDIQDRLHPPFLDLYAATWVEKDRYTIRSDARRYENWETNFAGKIGLGKAVDYALSWGIENIRTRITLLADMLRNRLSAIPRAKVHDLGKTKCGIVTFTLDHLQAQEIHGRLAERKMNVSVSNVSSTRLDMEKRGLASMVRASVHYYNDEDEIERFCNAIARMSST